MGWRDHLESLERDELHEILESILQWQIDEGGEMIHYIENAEHPNGVLVWSNSGETLLWEDK